MILFKNILARILKNNLDFFFKIIFQDYFAKILKINLEQVARMPGLTHTRNTTSGTCAQARTKSRKVNEDEGR